MTFCYEFILIGCLFVCLPGFDIINLCGFPVASFYSSFVGLSLSLSISLFLVSMFSVYYIARFVLFCFVQVSTQKLMFWADSSHLTLN